MLKNPSEVIESLEGSTIILEEIAEEGDDARLWAIIAALRSCIDCLDEDQE